MRSRLAGLVRHPLGAFPKGCLTKRIYRRAVNIAVLINVAVVLVFINPFVQAKRASAEALPVTPLQVIEDGAEMAGVAILRAEGYKIVESTVAKETVEGLYARLSPEGKQFWDTAVSQATQADKSPLWLKLLLPTALIGEIGGIMSQLTSDSQAGIADGYNAKNPSISTTLTNSTTNSVVWMGKARQVAIYSFTHDNNYTYIHDSKNNNQTMIGPASLYNSAYFTKIQYCLSATANVWTWTLSWLYTDASGVHNSTTTINNGPVTSQEILNELNGSIQTFFDTFTGLTADPDAVTADGTTVPTDPVSVTYPSPDAGISFDDWNKQVQDKTAVQDTYTPVDAEPTPTGTQDTTWWKWLMAPLDSILKMLQDLWNWLKDCWTKITEWATSIISNLADLLGAWNTWFTDLYKHFGDWFQTLWDTLGNLLTSLGNWLNPLGDWFAQVWKDIEALPSEFADFFKDLGADIVGLPDAIGGWFSDHIVGDPDNVQYDKLKQTGDFFTTKFPFSLPWDIEKALHAVFGQFSQSDAPQWDWTLNALGHSYTFTIKFPDMVISWAPFIRNVILITFDISLIYAVRKLLGGAQ